MFVKEMREKKKFILILLEKSNDSACLQQNVFSSSNKYCWSRFLRVAFSRGTDLCRELRCWDYRKVKIVNKC